MDELSLDEGYNPLNSQWRDISIEVNLHGKDCRVCYTIYDALFLYTFLVCLYGVENVGQ